MLQGSESAQCDKITGKCMCLPGLAGYRCEMCDRGTTGEPPNCVRCDECFYNWDESIDFLKGIFIILLFIKN